MQDEIRRLYRSRDEAVVAGICAGLGFYLRVDPVVVRLIWLLLTCLTGFVPGLIAYGVAWLIIPAEPSRVPSTRPVENSPA